MLQFRYLRLIRPIQRKETTGILRFRYFYAYGHWDEIHPFLLSLFPMLLTSIDARELIVLESLGKLTCIYTYTYVSFLGRVPCSAALTTHLTLKMF